MGGGGVGIQTVFSGNAHARGKGRVSPYACAFPEQKENKNDVVYLAKIRIYVYIHSLQLHPSTVWLREEFGSRAYFPDVMNTTFGLPHDIGRVSVSLVVEGADPAVPGTQKRKLTLNGDNGFHNPRVKLPPDLCKKLHNTFKCNICCSSPIKPPVIFSRCCKRLLGCQECVDRWFGGEEGV